MKLKTAVIIGAGYGGMALANLLGKSGYRVIVLEKNDKPGGRIHVVRKNGYTFDLGPSWYLMPEVFEQYYSLFGESAGERLDLMRFSPGYQVYYEGQDEPVVIQGDVEKDKQTFEGLEAGAGRRIENYVRKSTKVYELSVRYFLYNNFLRVRDVVNMTTLKNAPAMASLVAQNLHEYVAKKFTNLKLQQLLEYHMVFLGSSPFQAPAVYTLMSHLDFKSGVFYPRRGMVSLVDDMQNLGEKYDITYQYNSAVKEIVVESGVATGVKLKGGELLEADVVVSNADLAFTETALLVEDYQSFPDKYWKKRQPGPGALLVSLGVNKKLPQLIHHNLYFVERWRDNFKDIYENSQIPEHASIYVCNPSKTDPSLAPEGRENLFVLVPIPAGVEMDKDQQMELAKRVVKQFGEAIDEPDLWENIETLELFGPRDFKDRYNAWQYNAFGGESHLLRQSILFRTRNKSRKVKNLYYVGAGTLPGVGLPMCLISAQLAYKRIVGNLSSAPLTEEDVV